jgi:hypothetical protein
MNWAAWGPTIVSVIICVFFAGGLTASLHECIKRISAHDQQLNDHARDITALTTEVGMLKAFREGYATARAIYERQPHPEAGD